MPMGIGIGLSLDFGGKVGLFLPTAPADADYAFLSHPTYWASDASHLVPCSAGDAIRWWKDAVTGTWYEQATSGNRFIARQDVTGKWYAESTATQFHPWVDLTGVSATNLSFGVAYQLYSFVRYAMFITNTPRELSQSNATTNTSLTINNNTVNLADPTSDTLNVDYRHIAIMSGTTTIYRNGTSVASSADTTSTTLGVTSIGARLVGSFPTRGRFYGVLIAKNQNANVSSWDAALHGYCTA